MAYGNQGGGGNQNGYVPKDMSGSIFWVQKKSPKAPDVMGEIVIEGRLWKVAGWQNQTRGGKNYLSLKFSDPEMDQRRDEEHQQGAPQGGYGQRQGQPQRQGGYGGGQRSNGPSRGGYGGGNQGGGRNLPQGVRRGYYSNNDQGGQDQGNYPNDSEGP